MRANQYSLFAAVAFAVCLSGCETIQDALSLRKPTAKLTGVKFKDVKLDSATLLFDVEVENPYPVALPLTNLDYALASGANRFLSGSAIPQSIVAAKSKKAVSLPADINYIEMLKALKNIKPGSKIPYKAELVLSVDAPATGLIRLPLQKQGELVLPDVSDTKLRDIWKLIKPD